MPDREKAIQQAVNESEAGDTLFVNPGIYLEKNLVIKKPLKLFGIGYPVLSGESKYEVVSIKSSHVVFDGFRIEHTGHGALEDFAGIKIYNNSEHVTISNNILDDTFFGIYLQNVKHCLVKGNILKAYGEEEQKIGNGIHCWKSDSLQIIANRIEGHRDGIYFEFVTHSIVWRNISAHNVRYGLHFMFSHSDAYITNVFRNNGAGVAVMFTRNVKMYNNTFEQNWGDAAFGILLKEISDSHIEGNRFLDNTIAIYLDGGSRIDIKKNIFKDNGWAMRIQASNMDVSLTSNNFLGNTFDIATNGSLVLNTFNGNYWDKYDGYDIGRDNIGDVPYRPVSLYSMIIEKNPPAMILYRSIIVSLLDKTERIIPSLTPESLKDTSPLMKPVPL